MKVKFNIDLILKITFIILASASIGSSQSKGKKQKSTEQNSISTSYGKRLDSFAIKGNLFSIEIGFIHSRKFPFYIELNYFERQYENRTVIVYQGRNYVYGFNERTTAIETRFKLNSNLFDNKNVRFYARPVASIAYQYYKKHTLIQNQYDTVRHDLNLGIGIELKASLKLIKGLYCEISMDYIILRSGYLKTYNDNPLIPDFLRINNSFKFYFLDPYLVGKLGLKFLI